jgi:modulator of FtsH protease HflK
MSDDPTHHDHDHGPAPEAPAPEDAGTRALSEALRSSFFIVKVVMVILVAVFLCSGFFEVGPQQRKIILRFGRPVGVSKEALLGPGLHWAFPRPIDEVRTIPFTEIQTVTSTVGWYFTTPEMEATKTELPPGNSLNPAVDGYTLTSDGNIIHARAVLSYRIEDPIRYEFDFANASNSVRNALDNAVVFASARFKVDDILRRDPLGFKDAVRAKMNELAQKEGLGIVIEQCDVRAIPPRKVSPAFELVNTAAATAESQRLQALSEQNILTNTAYAEANSRTNSAEAERERLVKSVKADADRFTALLPRYQLDPGFFRTMLINQTVSQIMTNVQDKWYLPVNPNGDPWELRLQLGRPPVAARTIPQTGPVGPSIDQ